MFRKRVDRLSLSLVVIGLLLTAACTRNAGEPATRFPSADRIVAIGDLHGDLEATRGALRLAGAIDERDRWIGGELVVVQTGDVLDRGGDEQAIMDLFTRLEREAARAGGALHVLNGNHEVMNAALDLRYVTEEGYADFEGVARVDPDDSELAALEPQQRARAAAFRPGGPYAMVMARRNSIVIVGDNLFVHGGVLPAHVEYGIERINQEIRAWLRGDASLVEWQIRGEGPFWARHYSNEPDEEDCAILSGVLDQLGVKRMIMGHTIQDGGIGSLCDGDAWGIDVGMASHYGGSPQVLEIRGDVLSVLKP
jgi:hypothetical protein